MNTTNKHFKNLIFAFIFISVSFCFAQDCYEPWKQGLCKIGDKVSYNGRNYTLVQEVYWSAVPPPDNDYLWQDEGECDDGSFNGDILFIPDGEAVIPTWRNGATGAYTMICDDFGDLQFEYAYKPAWDLAREPQFSEIKLAFGAIAGKTSDADWDSAVVMVSQGHEIVNHSMYHTEPQSWGVHVSEAEEANAVINEKVYGRINTAGEYFAKGKKCEYFIFPYDDAGGYDILDDAGLVGARGGLRGETGVIMAGDFTYYNNTWDNNAEQSPFRIPFIANENTVVNMNATIGKIIAQKGYLIREFHAVCDKSLLGWYPVLKDDMRTHFEYLKQKIDANELVVYTPSEMVKHRKTALAFETKAVLTENNDNWNLKLTMKDDASVAEKYRDEISVLVNLGVAVEKLAVAYDGNADNTNEDNSPRIKPKKMDNDGKIWSVSINPFKTEDHSALLIRNGEWFGQGIDYEQNTGGGTANAFNRVKNISKAGLAGFQNGQINLRLNAGNYTVSLYNLQGRVVGSANITAVNNAVTATGLETRNLANGMFIIQVKDVKGEAVFQNKIMIK